MGKAGASRVRAWWEMGGEGWLLLGMKWSVCLCHSACFCRCLVFSRNCRLHCQCKYLTHSLNLSYSAWCVCVACVYFSHCKRSCEFNPLTVFRETLSHLEGISHPLDWCHLPVQSQGQIMGTQYLLLRPYHPSPNLEVPQLL